MEAIPHIRYWEQLPGKLSASRTHQGLSSHTGAELSPTRGLQTLASRRAELVRDGLQFSYVHGKQAAEIGFEQGKIGLEKGRIMYGSLRDRYASLSQVPS